MFLPCPARTSVCMMKEVETSEPTQHIELAPFALFKCPCTLLTQLTPTAMSCHASAGHNSQLHPQFNPPFPPFDPLWRGFQRVTDIQFHLYLAADSIRASSPNMHLPLTPTLVQFLSHCLPLFTLGLETLGICTSDFPQSIALTGTLWRLSMSLLQVLISLMHPSFCQCSSKLNLFLMLIHHKSYKITLFIMP